MAKKTKAAPASTQPAVESPSPPPPERSGSDLGRSDEASPPFHSDEASPPFHSDEASPPFRSDESSPPFHSDEASPPFHSDEADPLAFLDEPSAAPTTPPILEPAPPGPTSTAAGSAHTETDDWDLSFIADEAEPGTPATTAASLDLRVNEPAHEDLPVEPESAPELEFATPPQETLPVLDFDVEKAPANIPAPGSEISAPPTSPASPRSHAHELFSDNGGAPDEGLTAAARSDILDDLAALMPLGDDRSDDRIETEPTHSTRDIFAPILENLMSEEEMSRRLGDEPHPRAPRDAAEQARIDDLIPREYNTPGVVVHEIEDRPERSDALDAKRVRFPFWNKLWNGWLGWEGLEAHPSEWFVIGKLSARFALFGLLPVLLVVAISLPFSGFLYAHTSADYNRSSLLYSRPVVDLALPDTTVQTANVQPISARLLDQLSGTPTFRVLLSRVTRHHCKASSRATSMPPMPHRWRPRIPTNGRFASSASASMDAT